MLPADRTPTTELDLVADLLGDATRRAIFRAVTDSEEPLTAADVGERFDIHRTVARGHLEKLVEGGLLEARSVRRPEGGRPPKVYFRSARRLDVSLPARQYELLADLLLESVERFGPAGEMVLRDVGLEYGRQLGALAEDASSPAGLLDPLRAAGGRLNVRDVDEGLEVEVAECLYREVSSRRPGLVCALDRAIMEGMLSAGDRTYRLTHAERRTEGHDACRLRFTADGAAQPGGHA